jgi:hypothetical protein
MFNNYPEFDVDEQVFVIDKIGRTRIIGTKITEIIINADDKPKYTVAYTNSVFYDECDVYPTFDAARDVAKDLMRNWEKG